MRFRWLVILGALATLALASGYVPPGTMWVNVPFEFTINNTVLPAGEYSIGGSGLDGLGVLAIRSADSHHVVLFTGNAALKNLPPVQSSLEFHRYGNNYFLADIWWAGDTSGMELRPSKTERESAKTASVRRPEQVVLMASR